MWVWIPGVVVGMLLSLQMRQLGSRWQNVSGGTPNYVARLLPSGFSGISSANWLKWYLYAAYAFYSSETASAFVADSKKPADTLKFLSWFAWLMPFVYIGGSWVLMRLVTNKSLGSDLYTNLVAAATPFWGSQTSFLITLLITSSCLLGTATTVSNTPRILYQGALDGNMASVFGVVSHRGALEPALIFTLLSSFLFLLWGDVNRIVVVSGVCWFVAIMFVHLALWLRRKDPDVRWGRLSLGILCIEFMVLVVGGVAWGWQDFLIGLILPMALIALDAIVRHIPFAPFQPAWWERLHTKPHKLTKDRDFLVAQVTILIFLICATSTISWLICAWIRPASNASNSEILIIVLMTLAFVAVAIACWTSLPQVIAIDELASLATVQARQLNETLSELKNAQVQMVQNEKMSSLGQLVAGIAHEINNPVNFIHGNIDHLNEYTQDLLRMLHFYEQHHPSHDPEARALAEEIDLEFIVEDVQKMLSSMKMGTTRIRSIVLSLRNFSRIDESEFKLVDIHEGIESTLLILQYRLKDKPERPAIQIIRDYSKLPEVECYPGQLNQVLMNILANAIDALDEVNALLPDEEINENPSQISIRTSVSNSQWVEIAIADNGLGMPEHVINRIFDPFFTTKPVGKGTGMGMAISYQIITEKHRGKLECFSTLGKGTEFIIQVPMRQQVCSAV
jgi:signal transduction histidine kinase